MHYHCEIWLESAEDVEVQITTIMEPYDMNKAVDYHAEWESYWNPRGFWDWWQLGGRWKGVHVPDYDVNQDPANRELCGICNGTGDRPGWVRYELGERVFVDEWAEKMNGCNACKGMGFKTAWPTGWQPHARDVIPVGDIDDELECYTLIVDGDVFHVKEWNGKDFVETGFDGMVKNKLAELGIDGGYLVTVDYHS